MGGDAVFLLTDTRGAVGSVRPPPGGAAVELWAGAGLCPDGIGAVAELAVRRQGALGHYLGERLHGICLHHGSDAAGAARGGVRQDRRGLWRRIHFRPSGWRAAWRHGSPAAVLGRGGPERQDRKSTRLNSSHLVISYAVF